MTQSVSQSLLFVIVFVWSFTTCHCRSPVLQGDEFQGIRLVLQVVFLSVCDIGVSWLNTWTNEAGVCCEDYHRESYSVLSGGLQKMRPPLSCGVGLCLLDIVSYLPF